MHGDGTTLHIFARELSRHAAPLVPTGLWGRLGCCPPMWLRLCEAPLPSGARAQRQQGSGPPSTLGSGVLTPFPGETSVLGSLTILAGHRGPSLQEVPAHSPSAGGFVPTHFSLELGSHHPIYALPPPSPP